MDTWQSKILNGDLTLAALHGKAGQFERLVGLVKSARYKVIDGGNISLKDLVQQPIRDRPRSATYPDAQFDVTWPTKYHSTTGTPQH